MDARSWMQAAEEVARKSGDVALGFFRQGVQVHTKGDGSPVTVADQTAERTAREWIESRFPEDGILGEEFGETRPGARRRWILDPIDAPPGPPPRVARHATSAPGPITEQHHGCIIIIIKRNYLLEG